MVGGCKASLTGLTNWCPTGASLPASAAMGRCMTTSSMSGCRGGRYGCAQACGSPRAEVKVALACHTWARTHKAYHFISTSHDRHLGLPHTPAPRTPLLLTSAMFLLLPHRCGCIVTCTASLSASAARSFWIQPKQVPPPCPHRPRSTSKFTQ